MSHISTVLLKLALVYTLLFTACIGLIHAQPFDDSALRAFLTPAEGCPAPCFMGIRPGVTTVEETIAILEAHEWVSEVNVYQDSDGRIYEIRWFWDLSQVNFVDQWTTAGGYVDADNKVRMLIMETTIPFGSIWLAFGEPDQSSMAPVSAEILQPPFGYGQEVIYRSLMLGATANMSCPVQTSDYWQAAVTIDFRTSAGFRPVSEIGFQLPDWMEIWTCPWKN